MRHFGLVMVGSGVQMGPDVLREPQMATVARSKARQIKAKCSLAWQILSHVRFVIVAPVHDILVRISFKEFSLPGSWITHVV